MLLFASEFGGGWILFGCLALVLSPVLALAWIWLQVRSLLIGDRFSWFSRAMILCLGVLPGSFVFATLHDMRGLSGYSKFVFVLSVLGVLLLPVTITNEFLKFVRDRVPRHRRGQQR